MVCFARTQTFESEEHRNAVLEYQEEYEDEHLIPYPEFCQKKLELPIECLSSLPVQEERTRTQVINWIIKNLSYEELLYAGW